MLPAAPLPPDDLAADPVSVHTEMKLAIVSRYVGYIDPRGRGGGFLGATVKARRRRYISGYAGVGRNDFGQGHLREGTPLIALRAEVVRDSRRSRFTQLRFVEIDRERAATLERRVRAIEPAGPAGVDPRDERARVVVGDANTGVPRLLSEVEPATPTLVVLDPYDIDDLRFETVAAIGRWDENVRKHRIEQLIGLQVGRVRRLANIDERRPPPESALLGLERLLGVVPSGN